MTGLEVNVAKATGFVESPARFFAAVGQTTVSPEDAPREEPVDAMMDDLPTHVAKSEPRGEVVFRRE
eukprot:10471433-Karenia_brevis.AAC.1